jgi:hypothetical protein
MGNAAELRRVRYVLFSTARSWSSNACQARTGHRWKSVRIRLPNGKPGRTAKDVAISSLSHPLGKLGGFLRSQVEARCVPRYLYRKIAFFTIG